MKPPPSQSSQSPCEPCLQAAGMAPTPDELQRFRDLPATDQFGHAHAFAGASAPSGHEQGRMSVGGQAKLCTRRSSTKQPAWIRERFVNAERTGEMLACPLTQQIAHLWAWTLPLSNVDALSLVTAPVAVSYAGSLPEADAAAA